jgi:Tol biopolymer transport system component
MGTPTESNLYTMPIQGGTPQQLTFFKSLSLGGVWSPDGGSMAFASMEGGVRRVWIMRADGSSPYPVSAGPLSDTFTVIWSPAPEILYQKAGNQTFYRLDPKTGKERLLVEERPAQWIFNPVYSPDLTKIVVAWSRGSSTGVWMLESTGTNAKFVGPMREPIGWSADGRTLYAIESNRAAYRGLLATTGETLTEVRVVAVPLYGGAVRTVVDLPFEEIGGISVSPDGKLFVCAVYTSRSDVWITENFEPPGSFVE